MMRWLYSGVMWLLQPLLLRKLKRRSRQEPGYGQLVEERFGHYAKPVPMHHGPTVWLHAVSLGETRAAAVLVQALRQQLPHMRLLLTHGTATGRAEGVKFLGASDLQAWQPWDTPDAVRRFLTHFKPDLGLLMETEVWPNLVAGCQYLGVPLVLVNARLSDKSLRQAQRLAWLARPAFAGLAGVWAQTAQDAQRLQVMGAKVHGVLGNLKFDAEPNARQLTQGRAWRTQCAKPVVMFASSREGEELALLQIIKGFRLLARIDKALEATNSIVNVAIASDAFDASASVDADASASASDEGAVDVPSPSDAVNAVQWLIVPRHPQRFEAVAALIESHGFAVQRRSSWGPGGPTALATQPSANPAEMSPKSKMPTIWLGDSLGDMALYYGLADVALLGGSFEPLGGQNLIEAAACGCPVVMGPHTFNFMEAAAQALAAGAALRVPDLNQGVLSACDIALNQAAQQVMVQACSRFNEQNRGAVDQTAQAVMALLHQHSVDGRQIVSHQ